MATTIKYKRGGLNNMYVFWSIIDESGKRVWGGSETTKRKAEKAAQHEQRMVEAGHGQRDTARRKYGI